MNLPPCARCGRARTTCDDHCDIVEDRPCPNCGAHVWPQVTACPLCGTELPMGNWVADWAGDGYWAPAEEAAS